MSVLSEEHSYQHSGENSRGKETLRGAVPNVGGTMRDLTNHIIKQPHRATVGLFHENKIQKTRATRLRATHTESLVDDIVINLVDFNQPGRF